MKNMHFGWLGLGVGWIMLIGGLATAVAAPLAEASTEGISAVQLAAFRDPPAAYRPQIFMVWNGEVTEERITEMLEGYSARGIGGVFIHPRPGLITEYLSPRWFDLWEFTLEECRRLGLECHIYDENSYPSMFAGGHVISRNPHLAASYLDCVRMTGPGELPPGSVFGWYRIRDGVPEATSRDATAEASATDPVYALVLRQVEPRAQTAFFPYVDLTRPESTSSFLEITLEAYRKRFGDRFGQEIRYAFTDEPELEGGSGLVLSPYILAEFRREHGYDLRGRLGELGFGGPGAEAVRFDYFSTLNRLWVENFLRPYHDWCARNGLDYTGHFWEHTWPSPARQPSVMYSLRWMQAPGNDLLGFQFRPDSIHDVGVYYLNLKELNSIGNQLGRKRRLCETNGGGGYDMTLRDFKPLEDFAMVMGVNLINPHLSYQTIVGTRKYDWPQTLSKHSPWWPDYRIQADHVGRVLTALAWGRERNRVLVLQPDTTAWIHYQHPDYGDARAANRRLERLRQDQIELLLALQGGQIDFDLGDEFTLAELGAVENGRLRIGHAIYDTVVIPPAMENWTEKTMGRMSRLLESGGHVYGASAVPAYVAGRSSDRPAELARRFPENWQKLAGIDEIVAAIRRSIPPRLTAESGGTLPEGLCWRRHELPDDSAIYFLTHPWRQGFHEVVRLEGRRLWELDSATGEVHPVRSRASNGSQTAPLVLPPLGHAMWWARPTNAEVPGSSPTPPNPSLPIPLELESIHPKSPNVLVIDYCDWEAGDRGQNAVSTVRADQMNWQTQGFADNLWSRSSQFRRNFLDFQIPPDSGFRLAYHFQVEREALEEIRNSLAIAVEQPWLYTIRFNGEPLDISAEATWFDDAIGRTPIGSMTRVGANTLELEAHPFNVLEEIMPVYVLGNFHLKTAATGFILTTPKNLTYGPWDQQGLPFYPNRMAYTYRFHLDQSAQRIGIELPDWAGSSARIRVDGIDLGPIAWPPDRLEMSCPLNTGTHRLEVAVAGNLKNMMGPHFNDGLPGIWTWRSCPPVRPPGKEYRFYPTGLNQAPLVWANQP